MARSATEVGALRGVLAAAVTPLSADGAELDEAGFEPLVGRYLDGGLDGILALGTTGEGILLTAGERRRAAEAAIAAASGRLQVAVHCGAQTTAESVELARHAAAHGADAVAVIAPPYYPFDADELFEHFVAVARACRPLPFYMYEFAARSGYSIPLPVVHRVREAASNLVGLKVSNPTFAQLEPYLLHGLDVFVGAEELIPRGLERGAAGAVSGLAAGFPEEVAGLVRSPSVELGRRVAELRSALSTFPFPAVVKLLLAKQGVPLAGSVRAPLRVLSQAELSELEGQAADPGSPIGAALRRLTAGAATQLRE